MKVQYFPDTDTLYLTLQNQPSVESEEVSPDITLDFDAKGTVVGITIDHASRQLDSLNVETILASARISHKGLKNGVKNLRECNYHKASSGLNQ